MLYFLLSLHTSPMAQRRQSCHKLTLRIPNSEPYVTLLGAAKCVCWAPRILCTGVDPTFKSCGVKVQRIRHCLSQVVLVVRNPPANAKDIRNAGLILVENMATHSSILAWRIPWTKEPGGLQSMRSQRVRHKWIDLACTKLAKYPGIYSSLISSAGKATVRVLCIGPGVIYEKCWKYV